MLGTHGGNAAEEGDYAKEHDERQHGIDGALGLAGIGGKDAKADDERPRGQYLAAVNIKAGYLIVEAPLQNTAEQEKHQHHHGGGVGPHDGQVGDDERPRCQKGMVVSHDLADIGEETAVIPVFFRQLAEVGTDDQHGQTAKRNGDNAAYGAGLRQEQVARHHKGSPAHGTAEGQSPDIEGIKQTDIGAFRSRLISWRIHKHISFCYLAASVSLSV